MLLFDGIVRSTYNQVYIGTGADFPELDSAFHGQSNGLCGAGVPGALYLVTGLHTGPVSIQLSATSSTPELTDEWEDVVEVSFVVSGGDAAIVTWAGESAIPFHLDPATYRVRYAARGLDPADEAMTVPLETDTIDHYALWFWPAEFEPDAVVRSTSRFGHYAHSRTK